MLLGIGMLLCACRHGSVGVAAPGDGPGRGAVQTVAIEDPIVEVVAGPESTCARTARGRVACIGAGMSYTEEDPWVDTHQPQVIDVPASGGISAGDGFACSVDRDGGKVRCWGSNGGGRLGRETPGSFDHWALAVGELDGVSKIWSLGATTCALHGDAVACWGLDDSPARATLRVAELEGPPRLQVRVDDADSFGDRELFFGGRALDADPPSIRSPLGDRDIESFVRPWDDERVSWCGLANDGKFRCGETGFGAVDGMEVGHGHGCIQVDGRVSCRGRDVAGQAPEATLTLGGGRVVDLAVGAEHSCAVTEAGSLHCWGSSIRGQAGLPPVHSREPRIVAEDVARMWTLRALTCIEDKAGGFACAGSEPDVCMPPEFHRLEGPTTITEAFDAGDAAGCVVNETGSVWCRSSWGWREEVSAAGLGSAKAARSQFAALGSGDLCWLDDGRASCVRWSAPDTFDDEEPTEPRPVGPSSLPFGSRAGLVRLEGVDGALCALSHRGELACAQRGRGEWVDPRPETGWVQVDTPKAPVAALARDALVFADGSYAAMMRRSFQRPGGTELPSLVTYSMAQPSSAAPMKQAAGSCALLRSGGLWCADVSTTPTRRSKFRTLHAARHHACALDTRDRLWCWGDGAFGQLGDGQPACSRTPRDLSAVFYEAWETMQ